MPRSTVVSDSVVIAIDPHKASWTAAAVDSRLQPVATIRVSVSRDGYRQLRKFARRWPNRSWAIEGATGLGGPLTTRLAADGIDVVDVPPKLASRVRTLSTGHGRKNDDADAISVGVAALTSTQLQTAHVDEALIALRAIVEHREDLVGMRTQTINRLHRVVTQLLPGGAPTGLTADRAHELLRSARPRSPMGRSLRTLAKELISEVRRLDHRIASATDQISTALSACHSSLPELYGVGTVLAGRILARVGNIDRFRSAAAFASYTGTAPIEVSSGDIVRHRLSRAGDRQLNTCLHIMAIIQIRRDTDGRAYYRRKRAVGKSHKEALRCLKRRLSDVVYRQLVRDAQAIRAAGPAGHSGASLTSSAAD